MYAIKPWELSAFPAPIQTELNRRKTNRSFNYVETSKGGWDSDTGEWNKYKGPMSPWVRFMSNSMGREFQTDKNGNYVTDETTGKRKPLEKLKPGFVLFGGKAFDNSYGFNPGGLESGTSIIGYLPDGKETHTIDNDLKSSHYPIHVPAPEIERISVTIQKELFRRASVEWVCFSTDQLEYMTPYFLIPGISCVLEWGWNHFNPNSLVNLDNDAELIEYNNNPYPLYTKNILDSKGNYDVLFGRITGFEWTVEGNKFKCKTEITSQDRIYAGIVLDSNSTANLDDKSKENAQIEIFDNLKNFIDKNITTFRGVSSTYPLAIPEIKDVVQYIKDKFPDKQVNPTDSTWEDYVYGVFYGRDKEDLKTTKTDDNKEGDFDRKSDKNLWLNVGLVVEIINYHANTFKSFRNVNKDVEMFRVDIDDVVINAHPNLISANGSILLIPNAEAPKYFSGQWGDSHNTIETYSSVFSRKSDEQLYADANKDTEDRKNLLTNCTCNPIKIKDRKTAKEQNRLADYIVKKVCLQNEVLRDNLDDIINKVRYDNTVNYNGDFAFPSRKAGRTNPSNSPHIYSGYLKDLYVNVEHLQKIIKYESVKTCVQFIEKLLSDISSAAGNFWDFRLVSGTGTGKDKKGDPATMKIADYNFVSSENDGQPYTFDYMDADSLLLGVGFKPTLSTVQAARTIFAPTNISERNISMTDGSNELLDYKFRDRLVKNDEEKTSIPVSQPSNAYRLRMRDLQKIGAFDKAYQITNRVNGKIVVRRLVIPDGNDILKLLLNDGDVENNPQYNGIMTGFQATFTIQGIGGLRTFMAFLVRNLPAPYSHKNIIFRIIDVQDNIEAGKWTTTITAGIIPLRGYIKRQFNII